MFTGIVQRTGKVEKIHRQNGSVELTLRAPHFFRGLAKGASVSVHGVCLSSVRRTDSRAVFDLALETLRVTTLGECKPGSPLHLERPLKLGDELGGHLVQGHVDGRGRVLSLKNKRGSDVELRIQAPASLRKWLLEKGSIAINGVSLTLCRVKGSSFSVFLIPHTLKTTLLGSLKAGEAVNLEADFAAKLLLR